MITRKNRPLVSACIITYNHEQFVSDAIEGALRQIYRGEYEIVITDDCSTDRTVEIVEAYCLQYPNKIKLFRNKHNIGMNRNWVAAINNCKGEFIALCEGDDFWSNKNKISKQQSSFEKNKNLALSFHKVKIWQHQTTRYYYSNEGQKKKSSAEDLAKGNFIYTSSCMFRRNDIKEFPEWFYTTSVVDYPLFLLLSQHGQIGYIDRPMSTYRINEGGVWGNLDQEKMKRKFVDLIDVLLSQFSGIVKKNLEEQQLILKNQLKKN